MVDRLEGLLGLLQNAGLHESAQDFANLPQEQVEDECIEAVQAAIKELTR
jgi:hypothetical protein